MNRKIMIHYVFVGALVLAALALVGCSQASASQEKSGGGKGYQGAFKGLGELTIEQAAIKYRVDYATLQGQVQIPQGDPYESIDSLSSHGLSKTALQETLSKLGRIQSPDESAVATKRQQDFDALIALAAPQYRTALFSTSQKNVEASTRSIEELARLWNDISDLYQATPPLVFAGDAQWSADLAKIVQAVEEARAAIAEGNLPEGHELLEPVREVLLAVRTRNDAVVFADLMTLFHSAMEVVTAPSSGQTPESLTDQQVALVAATLPKMVEAWQGIETPPATLAAEQQAAYRKLAQAETDSIAALQRALQAGDRAGIIQAAADIKTNFSKLFAQFG